MVSGCGCPIWLVVARNLIATAKLPFLGGVIAHGREAAIADHHLISRMLARRRLSFGKSKKAKLFLTHSGAKLEPEYHRCYPEAVLQAIAVHARNGLAKTQVRIATPSTSDPAHSLVNHAWDMFWTAPASYVSWETKAVADPFENKKI